MHKLGERERAGQEPFPDPGSCIIRTAVMVVEQSTTGDCNAGIRDVMMVEPALHGRRHALGMLQRCRGWHAACQRPPTKGRQEQFGKV